MRVSICRYGGPEDLRSCCYGRDNDCNGLVRGCACWPAVSVVECAVGRQRLCADVAKALAGCDRKAARTGASAEQSVRAVSVSTGRHTPAAGCSAGGAGRPCLRATAGPVSLLQVRSVGWAEGMGRGGATSSSRQRHPAAPMVVPGAKLPGLDAVTKLIMPHQRLPSSHDSVPWLPLLIVHWVLPHHHTAVSPFLASAAPADTSGISGRITRSQAPPAAPRQPPTRLLMVAAAPHLQLPTSQSRWPPGRWHATWCTMRRGINASIAPAPMLGSTVLTSVRDAILNRTYTHEQMNQSFHSL